VTALCSPVAHPQVHPALPGVHACRWALSGLPWRMCSARSAATGGRRSSLA